MKRVVFNDIEIVDENENIVGKAINVNINIMTIKAKIKITKPILKGKYYLKFSERTTIGYYKVIGKEEVFEDTEELQKDLQIIIPIDLEPGIYILINKYRIRSL